MIASKTKVFMLDNLDSFTYNLVDEFYQLGLDPVIYRNTLDARFIFQQILDCQQAGQSPLLVLSPGPGAPRDAGCLMELIALAQGKFPMLGICLGHQALIEHYGGVVGRAKEIVHGKASSVTHNEKDAFTGLVNPLPVARYHSLVATEMPKGLTVTAKVNDLVMAIEQKADKVIGFQFHPESILTTDGSQLLAQSIQYLSTQEIKE